MKRERTWMQKLRLSAKNTTTAKRSDLAFRGAYQNFTITPHQKAFYSFVQFLQGSKNETKRVLREQATTLKSLKFNLVYAGYFFLGAKLTKEEKEEKKQKKFFHSKSIEIYSPEDVNEAVNKATEKILRDIVDFQQFASGWNFYRNISLDISIYKYKPVRGSSYIPLPPIIANKKACINVQNKDQECFKYSVLLHLHPGKNHDRVSFLKKLTDFDDWKGTWPMKRDDIPKFEKQFNLSINVYAYEKTENDYTFYPWYVTVVQENDNAHYVLIKSLSALVYSAHAGHGTTHICPCCFSIPKRNCLNFTYGMVVQSLESVLFFLRMKRPKTFYQVTQNAQKALCYLC